MMSTKIDVYEFINSKDIADLCRKTEHKFSAMECAYFVWRSNHHTLKEKHKAWQKIIDTMPDETFPDDCWRSLHYALTVLMKEQNDFLRKFMSSGKRHVYFLDLFSDNEYRSTGVVYDTYDACIKDLTVLMCERQDVTKAKICKSQLHSAKMRKSGGDSLREIVIGADMSVLDIKEHVENIDDKSYYLDVIFMDMPLSIPCPFKKGDIVIDVSLAQDNQNQPFVIEGFALDENSERTGGEDSFYRGMNGWFIDNDDGFFHEALFVDFLDMEYYCEELNGYENFLNDYIKYLQGEIGAGQLLCWYGVTLKNPAALKW